MWICMSCSKPAWACDHALQTLGRIQLGWLPSVRTGHGSWCFISGQDPWKDQDLITLKNALAPAVSFDHVIVRTPLIL